MERVLRSNILKSFLFVLAVIFAVGVLGFGRVFAAGDPNPSSIDLYFVSDRYKPGTGEIPTEYPTSYKINVEGMSGTPSYKVVSGSKLITVSNDGVITPVVNDRNYGTAVVKVTCGDYSKEISINVKNYVATFADKKLDSIVTLLVKDGMTDYQKVEAMGKWISENTDYGIGYTSYVDLLVLEKGDCWAASELYVEFCKKIGIKAKVRWAGADPGALSSTHRNAAVLLDGKCYVADAGTMGDRPRGYMIYELPYGFSVDGSTVYQYDGFDTDIVLPEKIGNKEITTFGNGKSSVFNIAGDIKLHLPKTITTIGAGAFSNKSDISITVDADNPYFSAENGQLYSKDKTKLYYTPGKENLTFNSNTVELMDSALSNLDVKKITIPGSVKTLGKNCFYKSKADTIVLEEGVETICTDAFYNFETKKLVLPSSVKTLEPGAFEYCFIEEVYLSPNIKTVPNNAFSMSQTKLKRVEIAEGTESIGNYAFSSCYAFKYVIIPVSVKSIGSEAFSGTSNTHIYYLGSEEDWNKITFGTPLPDDVKVHFNSVKVTGIDLNGDTDILLVRPNQNYTFTAKVLPENASDQDIKYESDNPEVARILNKTVYAVSDGTCKVTATTDDGGFSAVYNITVRMNKYKLTITGGEFMSLDDYYMDYSEDKWKTEGEFYEGDEVYIRATAAPDGYKFSKWLFNGGDMPEVLDPKYAGNTKEDIKMPGEDLTVSVEYSKVPVTSIVITAADGSHTVCPGFETDYSVKIYPDNAFDKTVTWASSNTSAATIDSKGHVKAIAPGYTVITATANDGSNAKSSYGLSVKAHNLTHFEANEPTKEKPGNIEYYKCETCGKYYSDAEGKNEITLEDTVIPALKHVLTLVKAKEPTCTEDGHKAYYECQDPDCGCKKIYSDKYGKNEIQPEDIVIPAGHKIEEVPEKDPTCTEDGYEKHYKCSGCDKLFSDAEGNTEIAEPVKRAKLGHDKEHLKHYDAKEPTYTEDGNIEYYECPRCGKYFTDDACENEITLKETILPKEDGAVLGESAKKDGLKFVVTVPYTDGRGTVTLTGFDTPAEDLVIPATVEIKGSIYKVNRIGANAFNGDTTVKTVSIGNNVVIIDANAFFGCRNLVKVSGGAGLKTIGQNAFARCPKLATFVITSKVLWKIGPQAFYKDTKLKTVYIRNTTKLTKGGVKKSLKGSSVKTVKVKKSKIRKYRKFFTKKNCGRKVKVKK